MQDAVHGLIEFAGLHAVVMDLLRCHELQRLRSIRQLGMANLVFPTAEHSRLTHALGTAHLGIIFGERLQAAGEGVQDEWVMTDEDVRDLAIAGLCHDIGHGPLSHVFETSMVGNFDRVGWARSMGLASEPGTASLSWHELIGQGLLAWPEGDLHRHLEGVETGLSERIRHLLLGHHRLPYLPGMLSGDIDIDRCDFLLRDSLQTGVPYGRFDIEWLMTTLTIGRMGDRTVAGYHAVKARLAIAKMLWARRAMYEAVYHHRTTRGAEALLGLLFRRLRDVTATRGWPLGGSLLGTFRRVAERQQLEPQDILMLDDHGLWTLINALAVEKVTDPTLKNLALRLRRRDLLRGVQLSADQAARWADRLPELVAACAFALPPEPEAYVWLDEPEASLPRPGGTLLLDPENGGAPIRLADDPELGPLLQLAPQTTVIYVPREAAPAFERLLEH